MSRVVDNGRKVSDIVGPQKSPVYSERLNGHLATVIFATTVILSFFFGKNEHYELMGICLFLSGLSFGYTAGKSESVSG